MTFTYSVGGYYPGGLEALAPAVDSVLVHQAQLLKAHAEQAARIK
jgi:hypothetical protein